MRLTFGRLAALAVLLSKSVVFGSPAVNVELRASWNAAPYLIELLETAADENSWYYFPLIDRIVLGGEFDDIKTDETLYNAFLKAAQDFGFLSKPEELSSFNFALAIRSASPRIEAHYHFYNSTLEPLLGKRYNPDCRVWLQWGSKQSCEASDSVLKMLEEEERYPNDGKKLGFDRVLGEQSEVPHAILFAEDILNPEFKKFHQILSQKARNGEITYRIRYKPDYKSKDEKSVGLSGYGVELALKKTDYLVMDDRDATETEATEQAVLKEDDGVDDIKDIKPLHSKDIATLGIRAASFVANSRDPFDSLVRMLEDFPKHSVAIANQEMDEKLIGELNENQEVFDAGTNSVWLNGQKLPSSQINAFSLLNIIRKERKNIAGLQSMGVNSSFAVHLLSHPEITEAKSNELPQRFDFRDHIEGGNVIAWLNNLEKDKRYSMWESNVEVLLEPVYPGQLHQIRKNLHHLVVPVDLTSLDDLVLVVDQLRMWVQRKLALRFGIVPLTHTPEAAQQAKIFYYLKDVYGLSAALDYLATSGMEKAYEKPSKKAFNQALTEATIKPGKTAMGFTEVLKDESLEEKVRNSGKWQKRLGITKASPVAFVNGHAVPRTEQWMREMSGKLQADAMIAVQGVMDSIITDKTNFLEVLLTDAAIRRNAYIFPQDDSSIRVIDTVSLSQNNYNIYSKLPICRHKIDDERGEIDLYVVGDFDEPDGHELLLSAARVQKDYPGLNILMVNNAQILPKERTLSIFLHELQQMGYFHIWPRLEAILDVYTPEKGFANLPDIIELARNADPHVKPHMWGFPSLEQSIAFWKLAQKIAEVAGFEPGQRGFIINGRVVGHIDRKEAFGPEDVRQLLEFEKKKRIDPVIKALNNLTLYEILPREHGVPQVNSLVTLINTAGAPTTLFDPVPATRVRFDKWKGEHTAIQTGNATTAVLQINALINPVSEVAQKWSSILKVLSQMEGISVRIFLNPPTLLQELPIKRFYRHVLEAKPKFNEAGRVLSPRASFRKLPEDSLLTLGLDVPPSWLVTPKVSIHDLDNIKLSAMKGRLHGGDVEAIYELRNILVEGHSRDLTAGGVPKGAQVVLSTEKDPSVTDTIIMANLGYFQFKANPGYWTLSLKEGRSTQVFKIESAGTKGYGVHPGDEEPDFSLVTFEGTTLFPRLSRKPGYEDANVLAPADAKTVKERFNDGFQKVDDFLSGAGLFKKKKEVKPQAAINIFSVASGHLYERFLNIMMLSVMKHTDKTVKFWFIENFLSPSFKDFLPIMAKEYKFEYELVTYKWPHWLRKQTEKQREIWGYKILFLDVLFPLDLDKIIFVDADQIVRTDMKELVDLDLEGKPYGFTPMCDSREEIEGFRFWKQGYWHNYLRGKPYHISALYVVDLNKFRAIAAGDRLRQQYHTLSADPHSLSNLDQDLPNNMQHVLPIFSLPQDWLWCETWCSDESLKTAKTIDLCNNPMTKEPKLDRARRQVPEWTAYDEEIAALARKVKKGAPVGEEQLVAGERVGGKQKNEDGQKIEGEETAKESLSEKAEPSYKDEL